MSENKKNNSGCFFSVAVACGGLFVFIGILDTYGKNAKGIQDGSTESSFLIFLFFSAIICYFISKVLE